MKEKKFNSIYLVGLGMYFVTSTGWLRKRLERKQALRVYVVTLYNPVFNEASKVYEEA